jgi:ligand-binding SRPBCC domain-containing protein
MHVEHLERAQVVARPVDEVFAFYARAGNLELITPPWLSFRVLTPEPLEMRSGTMIDYRLRLHGVPVWWTSRIGEWHENRLFVDRQVRGPYRLWHHRHEFEPLDGATRVRDRVAYALPLGRLGHVAGMPLVRRDLRRIFDYRQAAVARLLG